MKKRVPVIDALRGIAILAVAADHALFLFPQFDHGLLKEHMYFSIPWFIFLSGYTNSLKASQSPFWGTKQALVYLVKRSKLFIPYLVASAVCYLILSYPVYRFGDFMRGVLNFSIQPTYYFINLILQISLAFPVLYVLVKVCHGYARTAALFLAVTAVSLYFMRIPPLWPFSPAGRYFGGVYLLIFLSGIATGRSGFPKNPLFYGISIAVFAIYEYFVIATRGSFVWLIPNLHLTAWSLSLLFGAYASIRLMKNIPFILTVLVRLGRQSLEIYLYHFAILTLGMRSGITDTRDFIMLLLLSVMTPATLGAIRTYIFSEKKPAQPDFRAITTILSRIGRYRGTLRTGSFSKRSRRYSAPG